MKKSATLILAVIVNFFGIYAQKKDGKQQPQSKEIMVLFETTMGNIKIKLYNETPKHRDNFIKLVTDHTYDSLLFHRVIDQFMIQSGDVDSKKAPQGTMLGNGELGYTIPAEFMPAKYYHKKGALAAARQSDEVNPNKESSSCQFYIVVGRVFTNEDLTKLNASKMQQAKQMAFNKVIMMPENSELRGLFLKYQQEQKMDSLAMLSQKIEPMVMATAAKEMPVMMSEEAIKTYTTIGGTPHLDGGYTVFGEVVEGLDTVDKIAKVAKDNYDRPVENVRILKATIVSK